MSFFAILFALLIEQARPLARTNPIHAGLRAWALSVSRNFDAGKTHHGWVAWSLAVVVPALVTLAIHGALMWGLGWPFAVLWSVAVLYITLGFRQFSHHFTGIRDALEEGDEERARERLADWQQVDAGDLPRNDPRCSPIFGNWDGLPPILAFAGGDDAGAFGTVGAVGKAVMPARAKAARIAIAVDRREMADGIRLAGGAGGAGRRDQGRRW